MKGERHDWLDLVRALGASTVAEGLKQLGELRAQLAVQTERVHFLEAQLVEIHCGECGGTMLKHANGCPEVTRQENHCGGGEGPASRGAGATGAELNRHSTPGLPASGNQSPPAASTQQVPAPIASGKADPCSCNEKGPTYCPTHSPRTGQSEHVCQHDAAWDWVHEESRVCHALWDAGFAGPQSAELGAIMMAAKQICIRAWLAGNEAAHEGEYEPNQSIQVAGASLRVTDERGRCLHTYTKSTPDGPVCKVCNLGVAQSEHVDFRKRDLIDALAEVDRLRPFEEAFKKATERPERVCGATIHTSDVTGPIQRARCVLAVGHSGACYWERVPTERPEPGSSG